MKFALILFCAAALCAQSSEESYRVYTDHPRLFLNARRLRLLKREHERQSMRWQQFEALIRGGAAMPEPGFAYGLYYAVTGDAAAGKRAVDFALAPAADARQVALVFDWCQPALTAAQSKLLAAKLLAAARDGTATDVRSVRTRALAAIASAGESPDRGEAALRDIVESWWTRRTVPEIEKGRDIAPGQDMLALLELLHAIRDNLTIDLRESAPEYFKQLASFYVESHYPAPYPTSENEYRIPVYKGAGEPDLNGASASRAAGLALVAYDTNALENQFVQGWLIQDRFIMRAAFGSPYEFLWANPYQPGLSYSHLPLVYYDARSGDLFVRSSWEEDAVWFGLYGGEAQLFRDGRITVLQRSGQPSAQTPRVTIGDSATIALAPSGASFTATGGELFVIGLKPRQAYEVEVDDEEMSEIETDSAGTLEIALPKDKESAVRIRERNHS